MHMTMVQIKQILEATWMVVKPSKRLVIVKHNGGNKIKERKSLPANCNSYTEWCMGN